MECEPPRGEWLQVEEWRYDRIRELGIEPGTAAVLAADHDIDWHQLEHLLAGGCPIRVALEIIT